VAGKNKKAEARQIEKPMVPKKWPKFWEVLVCGTFMENAGSLNPIGANSDSNR
jgi:hypothetical protein